MSRKSLVIVEDSEQIVGHIRAVAENAGLQILGEAPDSQTAIELIARHCPDFVVLDLQLANGTSGFDVLNYLRDRKPLPRVVVLSANVDQYRSLHRAFARADQVLDKVMEFHLLKKVLSGPIESGDTSNRLRAMESLS